MLTPLFANAKMPNSTFQKNYSRRRNRRPVNKKSRGLIAAFIIAILLGILCIGFAFAKETEVKISTDEKPAASTEAASEESAVSEETAPEEPEVSKKTVGLNREKASEILHEQYDWNLKIINPDSEQKEIKVDSLIEDDLQNVLDDIFSGENKKEFTLDLTPDEEQLAEVVESAKRAWNVPAIEAVLVGYDKETDELIFGQGIDGTGVDENRLREDIIDAVRNRELDKSITVNMETIKPSGATGSDSGYKVIGTYTTHSTANENRNTNLNIACKAVNGTVLKPGEEFSFNQTTGNRTAEKGYKAAKAYRDNGVVVNEEGGGVCQVSSTLYNAVVRAGIKVNERHAHTYEPSYVTPGEDAMVSYDGYSGPDLRFTNNTASMIVIKARYSDRTVTCSIIGIPILKPNENVYMESEKVEEGQITTEVVEDPSVAFGSTVVISTGSPPTVWKTELIKTIDGVEVSRESLHTSRYRGHKKVVHTNTVISPEAMPLEENMDIVDGPASDNAGGGETPDSGTGTESGSPDT